MTLLTCALRKERDTAFPAVYTAPVSGPIGIFDSGLGGLTVLAALRRARPAASVVYVGDTARVPYGTKSPLTVRRYAREIGGFLERLGCRAVVVACNTASATALADLDEFLSVPVVGVLEPGARAAAAASKTGRIGVLGTRATIRSGAYQTALFAARPGVHVVARAAPLFVPLVEEGHTDDDLARAVARMYLTEMREIDTLLLGCTHYPLLIPVLAEILGPGVTIVDSATALADAIDARVPPSPEEGRIAGDTRFYATDDPDLFRSGAERFLGEPIGFVERLTPEMLEAATAEAAR